MKEFKIGDKVTFTKTTSVGTIIYIDTYLKIVKVKWDHGLIREYRLGHSRIRKLTKLERALK